MDQRILCVITTLGDSIIQYSSRLVELLKENKLLKEELEVLRVRTTNQSSINDRIEADNERLRLQIAKSKRKK